MKPLTEIAQHTRPAAELLRQAEFALRRATRLASHDDSGQAGRLFSFLRLEEGSVVSHVARLVRETDRLAATLEETPDA